jgi:hypothetical protein
VRGSVQNGFSIFETVAILVIVGLLLLIVVPQFTRPSLAAVAGPDSVVAPGSFGKLEVKVSDVRGTPQQGVAVRFEVEGKGNVSPVEASTDSAGIASVVWQAAPDTGTLNVTARAAGRSRPTLVFRSRVRGQPQTVSPAAAARPTP